MSSNNQTINRIVRALCSWGTQVRYKPAGRLYLGGPAPIFRNLYKTFFLVFTILNFLLVLFDITAYIINTFII